MRTNRFLLVAALAVAAYPLHAQDEERPERGVARISLINGDVSVLRGDSGEWVAGIINAPLVVQDRVLSGPGSRSEIQFDYANMLRLSPDTEVRLSDLDYQRYQIQVARGTVTFRVLRDSEAEVEIATPSVSVRPIKQGVYRITVRDDGTAEITVRAGEADIFTPRGTERLRSGRTLVARGTASDPEYQFVGGIPTDDWDRWNEKRDHDLERAVSSRYVNPSVYGAEDLDSYGDWSNDGAYGWVWTPRVAAGWSPYHYGRWSWIDWYGWSWVSYDPWGWAPYHYGRWYYGTRGWCWWPGAIQTRHYWSPGLVSFFGFGGGGVSVGVGWGNVGWVPLAPFETYRPWYGRNVYAGFRGRTTVVNNVQIVNNVNVFDTYRNARHVNGITALSASDFSSGRHGNFVRVSNSDIQRVSMTHGMLPVAPERGSTHWADGDAKVRGRAGDDGGRFFSHRGPSQTTKVSFEDQRRGMEDVSRRAFHQERGAEQNNRGAEQNNNGWRRAGEANNANPAVGNDQNRAVERQAEHQQKQPDRQPDSGWRRFGEPRSDTPARTPDAGRNAERQTERQRQPDRQPDNGWKRFGEPRADSPSRAPEAPRNADPGRSAERPAERMDRGNPSRAPEAPRNADPGRSAERPAERMDRGSPSRAPEAPRNADPGRSAERGERRKPQENNFQQFRETPRPDSGQGGRQPSSEPARISPPVVRERSAPRPENISRPDSGRGDSGRGGSGGGRSSGGNDSGGRSGGGHGSRVK